MNIEKTTVVTEIVTTLSTIPNDKMALISMLLICCLLIYKTTK